MDGSGRNERKKDKKWRDKPRLYREIVTNDVLSTLAPDDRPAIEYRTPE
ncbi:hypothetical protein [Erwinia sp. S59]|nr:hypothetical protein [Erwinia sp. S59]MBK0091599.1 hypothetical protein [Erwinia sp. S59]